MYLDILIAFILDIIIGDPEYKYHPVRIIGIMILFFENKFRKISKKQKLNGILFGLFIIIFPTGITVIVVYLLSIINIFFFNTIIKNFFIIFIIYSSISLRDLHKKAFEIYDLLSGNQINDARYKLSFIVGRETKKLNKIDIIRATIETVAENIADGIFSPLFFAFFGGAPFSILFKATSTLDSMIGYKNSKYKDFGWFSAKLDDILNFIPARIAGFLIAVSFIFFKRSFLSSFKILIRDGKKNPSPNSGLPEAAVAGGLGIQLGGINYYHGNKVLKPIIGEKLNNLEINNIKESIYIAYISSFLFLFLAIITEIIVKGFYE